MLREDHEFPRIQKHRGARRVKKAHYYGPFASAGSVTRTLNALQKLFLLKKLFRQLFRESVAALPAVPDQALLGAVRRADRRGAIMASWSRRRRSSLPASRRACSRGCRGRWRRPPDAGLRARRGLSRPVARADLHPGQPDGSCRRARRCRRLRARVQGRKRVDPGLLHPRRAELGASRFLSGAYQRCSGSRGFVELSSSSSTRTCRRPKRILVDRELADRELLEEALSERAERKVVIEAAPARRPPQAARTGAAQCRGGARPPARGDHHPGQDPARAGRCRSTLPTCPSESRFTTTATSWAPTRPAR